MNSEIEYYIRNTRDINLDYTKIEIIESVINLRDINKINKFSAYIKAKAENIISFKFLDDNMLIVSGEFIAKIEYLDTNNNVRIFNFTHPLSIEINIPSSLKNLEEIFIENKILKLFIKKISNKSFYFSSLCIFGAHSF